jgi:predicted lipoprotein with Yx(FWY)xxD motif
MVQAATVGGLGKILVDGKGITLYMFTLDHRGQPSVCYQFCAVEWPPLTLPSGVTKPIAGPGIKASLLGTTRRSNGQLQVTYDGWPLYLWYGDTVPGSTSGQALANAGGLWYVLRPSGQIVR